MHPKLKKQVQSKQVAGMVLREQYRYIQDMLNQGLLNNKEAKAMFAEIAKSTHQMKMARKSQTRDFFSDVHTSDEGPGSGLRSGGDTFTGNNKRGRSKGSNSGGPDNSPRSKHGPRVTLNERLDNVHVRMNMFSSSSSADTTPSVEMATPLRNTHSSSRLASSHEEMRQK